MKKRKKKARRKMPLVPRRGPPSNLRPAGAHADKRRHKRSDVKDALRAAIDEAEVELPG